MKHHKHSSGQTYYTHRGYEIVRGSYVGTSDDRIDRWYVEHPDMVWLAGIPVDRTGPGFRTRRDAADHIDDYLTARGM